MKKTKKFVAALLALLMILGMFGDVQPVKADDASGSPITIDADASDWYYIEPLYSAGGVISKLSGFTYANTLYLKMEVSNTSNYDTWHIYLDTDGDYTNHLFHTGADFVLETDWMYKYEGESGEWDDLQSTGAPAYTAISGDKKVLEIAIPFESLDNPEKIAVSTAVVGNWIDVATVPGAGEYLEVPAYEDVLKDTIVGLTPAELEELEASKQFAGTPKQWEAIDYDAVFQNSNLKSLKAVSDGEFLYINASAKKLSNNFTVYISTEDEKGGTDKSDIWTDGNDMGFQIKANGTAYKMKGNRKDLGTAMPDFYKSEAGFEIKIPLEFFGSEGTTYRVAIEDGNETIPDAGHSLLTVTLPIMSEAPSITVDGNPDDWKDVAPIGEGMDTLGKLYAIRTNDDLYVMTYISGVTDPESSAAYTTSLFIDSDNDTKTGFQHVGYPLHSGANMLVQDWYSYGPDRNLEFFYTDAPVILPWNMKKQFVEGYEKVFAPTDKAGVYCAEWRVPVSVMKEATNAVGDDMFICVDRDDCQTDEETYERMTPYGYTPATDEKSGSFARVPKYLTKFEELKFDDFDFSDWDGICNTAKHENLLNLYAVRSVDKLYTLITAADELTTDNRYYISTEADGFTFDGYNSIKYYIEKGRLYEVTGDNTLSSESRAVYQNYSSSAVLMQLYLEWIGNPSKIEIAVNSNSGEIILPESGMLGTAKVVDVEREAGVYYPVEDFEMYNNPYKGWVGWADICEGDIDDIAVTYDLVYVDIKWSEIEKVKGVYDFDAIEEQYQFKKWLDKGCRMVLRFVMDNPNLDETRNPDIKRMDIPQWLYDELEAENAEGEGAGVFYNGDTILTMLGGVGFSPNYKSPTLLEYHRNMVKALADRYDDPSVTAYVEVGSLGHWAEFHTWPTGTGEFPDPPLAQEYMRPYADYFKNVKVGIRKPYALSAENNWGLYNDIFGITSDGGTPTFLEWAASGNTDMPGSTEEDIAASKMPEWWKLNYSGGEFANGDFRSNAQNETVCAVLDQIRDSHTTWLGPCSACDIKYSTGDYDKYAYNIEVLYKTMGYRYNLASITQPEAVVPGADVNFKMVWNNNGVAPIYYNCPVTLMFVDENGETAFTKVLDVDTREWQSGRTTVSEDITIPADLAEGNYEVRIKMNAADSKAETIYLAMDGLNEDGSYSLYNVAVSKDAAAVVETEETEEVKTDVQAADNTADVENDQVTEEKTTGSNVGKIIGFVIIGLVVAGVAAAFVIRRKKK